MKLRTQSVTMAAVASYGVGLEQLESKLRALQEETKAMSFESRSPQGFCQRIFGHEMRLGSELEIILEEARAMHSRGQGPSAEGGVHHASVPLIDQVLMSALGDHSSGEISLPQESDLEALHYQVTGNELHPLSRCLPNASPEPMLRMRNDSTPKF